jgi:hypothetical protein
VASDRLYVRVFNDSLPDRLQDVDKLEPAARRDYVERFWVELGGRPLGDVAPGLLAGFWQPDGRRVWQVEAPALLFGHGRVLCPPAPGATDIREYFARRPALLDSGGCYEVPPSAPRTIQCVYPSSVDGAAVGRFASDICRKLGGWTATGFSANLVPYDRLTEATEQLRANRPPGLALVILTREPSAYYEAAVELPDWRVKRVTIGAFHEHYDLLTRGRWDRRARSMSLQLGRRQWESFVTLNALNVLEKMDGIPWRIESAGPYEAQFVIDVGHDHRYYALSRLVARSPEKKPSFGIYTNVFHKCDPKCETINDRVLEDEMVRFFAAHLPRRADPIASMLVLRDGRICGREPVAVDRACERLATTGLLAHRARVDVVEYHKESLRSIRMWEVLGNGRIDNVEEGTAVDLGSSMALLANTGRTGLHQGTADLGVRIAREPCQSIRDAVTSCFASAQLNYSSPSVPQRLMLPFKRTDDELSARSQQEIRRFG